MIRSLEEFHISGIETNIPFCLMVLRHKSFQDGNYSTHTLESMKDELQRELAIHKEESLLAARIGAVKFHHHPQLETNSRGNHLEKNKWTFAGRKNGLR